MQFSLLAALAADDYAGGAPLRDVLAGGDFGVGTFDRLDGEMIVLDGKIYQALADGTVRAADLDGTTPFAAVTFFDEDGRIENLSAATLDDLDAQLDRKLPHRNSPYALRITGEFADAHAPQRPRPVAALRAAGRRRQTPGHLAAPQPPRHARRPPLPRVDGHDQRLRLPLALLERRPQDRRPRAGVRISKRARSTTTSARRS